MAGPDSQGAGHAPADGSPSRRASSGVLIACRPGIGAIGPDTAGARRGRGLWSVSTILIRLTKLAEPTSVNMVMTNAGFFVLAGAMLPLYGRRRRCAIARSWGRCRCAGALSQYLVFEALRRASASTIAPLEFTSLGWAFILQYLVWGRPPDALVLSGALLIGVERPDHHHARALRPDARLSGRAHSILARRVRRVRRVLGWGCSGGALGAWAGRQ